MKAEEAVADALDAPPQQRMSSIVPTAISATASQTDVGAIEFAQFQEAWNTLRHGRGMSLSSGSGSEDLLNGMSAAFTFGGASNADDGIGSLTDFDFAIRVAAPAPDTITVPEPEPVVVSEPEADLASGVQQIDLFPWTDSRNLMGW